MSEQRLREFIDNDITYQDYKMMKPTLEYQKLHIALCEDIENVLNVLDEIREYIKEHNDYLEKAKKIYIGYEDELLKSTCIQLINNELVRSDDLLQILDKVKNNDNKE